MKKVYGYGLILAALANSVNAMEAISPRGDDKRKEEGRERREGRQGRERREGREGREGRGWHGKRGGHGGCRGRMVSGICYLSTLTTLFAKDSVKRNIRLDVDHYKPFYPKEYLAKLLEIRPDASTFKAGDQVNYTLDVYDEQNKMIGKFEDGTCGQIPADYQGESIQLNFDLVPGADFNAKGPYYSCKMVVGER